MKLLSERLAHIYSERPDLEGDRGQIGLVQASGASKSMVNQWLAEKIKSIDIMYALKIEESLGYSHIWLMTGLGNPKVGPGERIVVSAPKVDRARLVWATPPELDLLELYRLSTDRSRIAIMRTAERATKRPAADALRDEL